MYRPGVGAWGVWLPPSAREGALRRQFGGVVCVRVRLRLCNCEVEPHSYSERVARERLEQEERGDSKSTQSLSYTHTKKSQRRGEAADVGDALRRRRGAFYRVGELELHRDCGEWVGGWGGMCAWTSAAGGALNTSILRHPAHHSCRPPPHSRALTPCAEFSTLSTCVTGGPPGARLVPLAGSRVILANLGTAACAEVRRWAGEAGESEGGCAREGGACARAHGREAHVRA